MREAIFKCDICHCVSDPDEMIHTESGKDVCATCLADLVDKHFDDQEKKFEEVIESASAKKQIKLKKPAPVVKFDWKKAQALRDAGWTVAKVAKEMKCSAQSVCNNTKPPKEKKSKKPLEWVDDDSARLGITDKDAFEEVMADGIS